MGSHPQHRKWILPQCAACSHRLTPPEEHNLAKHPPASQFLCPPLLHFQTTGPRLVPAWLRAASALLPVTAGFSIFIKRKCTTLEFSIVKPVAANAKRSKDKCFHASSCSVLLTMTTDTFFIVWTLLSPFSSVSCSGKVLAVGQLAKNGFKWGTTERDVKSELSCSQMRRRQLK